MVLYIYKLFQRILSRFYWLKYRENDRDRVSPFTDLSPYPDTESFSLLKQVNSYLQHLVFPILIERTLFP